MTESEAEEMLRVLTEHYKQPVMPIGKYCKALETWRGALRERHHRALVELYPDISSKDHNLVSKAFEEYNRAISDMKLNYVSSIENYSKLSEIKHCQEVVDQVDYVFLQIRKSNLLARLLYDGERLRTTPCPEHKGRWSGCVWKDLECGCMSGCNVTGWLPEK